MHRRGRALQVLLNQIRDSLMSIGSAASPSLMLTRVRSYLHDAEKKIVEFESSYNEYLSKLPPREQGAAMREMNDIMVRYEANISHYQVTLDDQEMLIMESS